MTDIVEIMARAIVDARGEHPEGSQHHFVDGKVHSATFLKIADHNARAAISALTEAGFAIVPVTPTEAMVQRGARNEPARIRVVGQVWADMIEAGSVKT